MFSSISINVVMNSSPCGHTKPMCPFNSIGYKSDMKLKKLIILLYCWLPTWTWCKDLVILVSILKLAIKNPKNHLIIRIFILELGKFWFQCCGRNAKAMHLCSYPFLIPVQFDPSWIKGEQSMHVETNE
jgi:hypothetical protein